jgi:hypothetical protein
MAYNFVFQTARPLALNGILKPTPFAYLLTTPAIRPAQIPALHDDKARLNLPASAPGGIYTQLDVFRKTFEAELERSAD